MCLWVLIHISLVKKNITYNSSLHDDVQICDIAPFLTGIARYW